MIIFEQIFVPIVIGGPGIFHRTKSLWDEKMQFTEIYWPSPVHTTFPVLWNQTCLSIYDCLALWWSVNPYTTTVNGVFFSSGGRCLTFVGGRRSRILISILGMVRCG